MTCHACSFVLTPILWRFPTKMGVHPIIQFSRVFPNKNHPFWGYSIYGNPHIMSEEEALRPQPSEGHWTALPGWTSGESSTWSPGIIAGHGAVTTKSSCSVHHPGRLRSLEGRNHRCWWSSWPCHVAPKSSSNHAWICNKNLPSGFPQEEHVLTFQL